jgi:hypothetical protein
MMKLRRIVYPLFFMLVLALVVIPSSPLKVHASNPIYAGSVGPLSGSGGTVTLSVAGVIAGDFIGVVAQPLFGVANGYTFTDTFSDTFIPLYTGSNSPCNTSSAGLSTYSCVVFTQASGGGTDVITITETNGFTSGPSAFADHYTNVLSTSSPTIRAPCTTTSPCGGHSGTDTFNPALATGSNQIVWEVATIVGNSALGASGVSANSGQTVISSFFFNSNSVGAVKSFQSTCTSSCPSIGWTTDNTSVGTFLDHGAVIVTGSNPSNLGSLTACYGDCGNPAVTFQNGNSTHLVNFNTSITLFYRFQSNLNGFLLNETVNVAKTYTNGQQVGLGIYTATCNAGVTPFTSACPGQQRAATISNPSVPKGKFSLVPSPISVTVGMWIAIGFTAIYAGLDLNVTNAACLPNQNPVNSGICDTVGMQYTTGTIPQLLSSSTKCSQTGTPCNVGVDATGVWSWITGNTVTTPPPIGGSQGCGGDIVCFMTSSACALTPSNCLIGALAFGLIYSFISIILLEVVSVKIGSGMTIPGGVYVLTFMGWMTFWTLIVGAIWFVVLEILAVILLFSAFFGTMVTGQYRNSGKGGRDA